MFLISDLGNQEGDDFACQGQPVVESIGGQKGFGTVEPAFGLAGGAESNRIKVYQLFTNAATKAFFDIGADRPGAAYRLPGQFVPARVFEPASGVLPE